MCIRDRGSTKQQNAVSGMKKQYARIIRETRGGLTLVNLVFTGVTNLVTLTFIAMHAALSDAQPLEDFFVHVMQDWSFFASSENLKACSQQVQ